MSKRLLSALMLMVLALPGMLRAADYGLPTNIQDGNILHCFNWPVSAVKEELPNIAAAGFGTVQLSPMQRSDVRTGSPWHDLYRPYDLAFKGGLGSREELKALCAEAANYGIKIIVDVVANHVDKTAGYHDPWWDGNGRVRWEGGINYGDRRSITHGQLGDYGDVNSEDAGVIARGKAYVEDLKSMGVKGCRWDAAKHIGLPSEGCGFWSSVTSVPGMYHYGEILDAPGPNEGIIKEYGQYMSVTDNKYCNYAARDNGGIPGGHGGSWDVNHGLGNKVVYWAESHDTYSNDNEWSMNVDQSVIDRAYAAYACRKGASALYLSRPKTKGFNNIKVSKGTEAFKGKHIAAVNKFRNAMVGKADYFTGTGNACSITRQGGGAVIVMKGSGNISIANGGGYCPAGTYKDMVSGGTFTVTASTISGNVGSSGIAVIMKDGVGPDPNPGPDPDPDPDPDPTASMWILGNLSGAAGWSTTPGTGMAMTQSGSTYTAKGVTFVAATGETTCYFNLTDYVGSTWDDLNMTANRYGAATEGEAITLGSAATIVKYANGVDASGCLSWTVAPGTYDITADLSSMKLTVVKTGDNPNPNPDPDPDPTPGTLTITGDYNLAYSGDKANVHYWGGSAPSSWPGVTMTTATGSDGKTYKVAKIDATSTGCLFNTNGNENKTGDLTYSGSFVMTDNGPSTTAVTFKGGDNPGPDPIPDPSSITIYYDNSVTSWSSVNCYSFVGTTANNGAWPGKAMTLVEGKVYKATIPAGSSVVFNGDSKQTVDVTGVQDKHIYKGLAEQQANGGGTMCNKVEDGGVYGDGPNPQPTKPVVSASPASGSFSESITVTLSVTPAGSTIYYTTDNSTPTESSTKYTAALKFTETTTLNAFAVAADGTKGDVKSFRYTKSSNPGPQPQPGNNLITDYYKVNPDGHYGTNKTINVSGHPASNAFSNWTEAELIAQGVARDVCQAFRGTHERPIVDSYAVYAAYDNQNLYLGVQMVYAVWDAGGEGKQPGESKPHNMDGHMIWAFDLDPNQSFDGYINGTGPIWSDQFKGAKFENGVDHVLMASTKPQANNFTFFKPTPDGHASYDPEYCIALPEGLKYGYADGLLPSIEHIWGQSEFGYDPELLKGNTGFVDLRGEVDDDAHTFYEFKIPLSLLGVTEDYIRTNGIGVMYIDKYGVSPVGGTPYDPSYFDDPFSEYSYGDNTSKEKEDEDIITYAPARIGAGAPLSTNTIKNDRDVTANFRLGNGFIEFYGLNGESVSVSSIDGRNMFNSRNTSDVTVDLPAGIYIINIDGVGKAVRVR